MMIPDELTQIRELLRAADELCTLAENDSSRYECWEDEIVTLRAATSKLCKEHSIDITTQPVVYWRLWSDYTWDRGVIDVPNHIAESTRLEVENYIGDRLPYLRWLDGIIPVIALLPPGDVVIANEQATESVLTDPAELDRLAAGKLIAASKFAKKPARKRCRK